MLTVLKSKVPSNLKVMLLNTLTSSNMTRGWCSSTKDKSKKKTKTNPVNKTVQKSQLSASDIEMCKSASSSCDKTDTSCKMPTDEVEEDFDLPPPKVGKPQKRDVWTPLDYIHRMDLKKSKPRVYTQNWKECPRIVIQKAICTAEEIECPIDPNEKPRFVKTRNEELFDGKSLPHAKFCEEQSNDESQQKIEMLKKPKM